MPTVAELNAMMSLNVSGFVAGLDKAQRELRRQIARMEKETGETGAQISKNLTRELVQGDSRWSLSGIGRSGREALKASLKSDAQEALQYTRGMISSLDRGGGIGQTLENARRMSSSEAAGLAAETETNQKFLQTRRFVKTAAVIAGGMELAKVATEVWQGDLDKAKESLESMPYGIGHIVTLSNQLREMWGLMPSYIRDSKNAIKEMDTAIAVSKAQDEQRQKFRTGFRAIGETWRARYAGAARPESDVLSITTEAQDAIRAIDQLEKEQLSKETAGSSFWQNAKRRAAEDRQTVIAVRDLEIQKIERREKIEDEARMKASEFTWEQLKSETEMARMRADAVGSREKEREAIIAQIRESARLKASQEDNWYFSKKIVEEGEQQVRLQEAQWKHERQAGFAGEVMAEAVRLSNVPTHATPLESRTLSGWQSVPNPSPEANLPAATERVAKNTEKTNQLIEELKRMMARNPGIVVERAQF